MQSLKCLFTIVAVYCFLTCTVMAQQPFEVVWQTDMRDIGLIGMYPPYDIKNLYINASIINSSDSSVHKLNTDDGHQVWQMNGSDGWRIRVQRVDNNGNVYISYIKSDILRLHKFDSNGNQVWQTDIHDGVMIDDFWTAVDEEENVYISSINVFSNRDNFVKMLDSDGNQIWQFDGNDGEIAFGDVDDQGNVYIYSNSTKGTLYKIDPYGNQIWQFDGHDDWVTEIRVYNNNVHTSSRDGTIRKIDPYGNQIWVFDGHNDWVNIGHIDQEGNIYTFSHDNTVRKLDPNGNQIWIFDTDDNWVILFGVDSDGHIYTSSQDYPTSNDTIVRKLDPNGSLVWQIQGNWIQVEVDNEGYIYTISNKIHMDGSADGTVSKLNSKGQDGDGPLEKKTMTLNAQNPNIEIFSGTDARLYGTSSPNRITLERGARAELFYFPGQNTIEIQSNSNLFQVHRSGNVVTFQGSDGTELNIPATKDIQIISFNDRSLTLSIYNNQVMLDDQVIGQDMDWIH